MGRRAGRSKPGYRDQEGGLAFCQVVCNHRKRLGYWGGGGTARERSILIGLPSCIDCRVRYLPLACAPQTRKRSLWPEAAAYDGHTQKLARLASRADRFTLRNASTAPRPPLGEQAPAEQRQLPISNVGKGVEGDGCRLAALP